MYLCLYIRHYQIIITHIDGLPVLCLHTSRIVLTNYLFGLSSQEYGQKTE